jgi:hypothetical protein
MELSQSSMTTPNRVIWMRLAPCPLAMPSPCRVGNLFRAVPCEESDHSLQPALICGNAQVSAEMSGSGNLGVHPLMRADQDDLQFWTWLPEIHGNAAPPGAIIASHFAQVRRTLEHGSASDL